MKLGKAKAEKKAIKKAPKKPLKKAPGKESKVPAVKKKMY